MRRYHETFRLWEYLLFTLVTLAVLCLCVCVGSVRIPLADTLSYFAARLTGGQPPAGLVSSILPIRLPRVLCVALTGAALSLAGAAMQGLLKTAGRRLDARRFVRRVARRGHCHCLRRDAAGSAVRGDNGYGDRVRVLIAACHSRPFL